MCIIFAFISLLVYHVYTVYDLFCATAFKVTHDKALFEYLLLLLNVGNGNLTNNLLDKVIIYCLIEYKQRDNPCSNIENGIVLYEWSKAIMCPIPNDKAKKVSTIITKRNSLLSCIAKVLTLSSVIA